MKIVYIKNIIKKEVPLHYRNEYSGTAVLQLKGKAESENRIEFIIERSALATDVRVVLLEKIDYPTLPLIRSLKTYILDMDKTGKLP